MATSIPKRAETRIKNGIKQFRKVIAGAKDRDVNESDTVTILADMLAEICGYDKYTEITREYAIRNTFCDLAIKLDEKPVFLIEVKAIGISLKPTHIRQALNYAANEGIEWVILTNGDHWQGHRVVFSKPVKTEVAFNFHFLDAEDLGELTRLFFLFSKEGVKKSAIDIFHEECQITSRYMVAAALQTDAVVTVVRRQLASISKNVKIDKDRILQTIQTQVLKREVLEGEEAVQAKRRLTAAANKAKRKAARAVEQPPQDTATA